MVWRDIDLHVYCGAGYSADRCFEALRPLAAHPMVKKLRWDNERGERNTGWLPDGYYFGVRAWRPERVEWKLDIWFLPAERRAADQAQFEALRSALTPETRSAILRIKGAWHANPDYRSLAVYDPFFPTARRHTLICGAYWPSAKASAYSSGGCFT